MKKLKSTKVRALLLVIAVAVFFLVFTGRMVYIQVGKTVEGNDLASMADSRYTTTETVDAKRGTIFDKQGEPLAEQVPSYSVYAVLDESYDDHVKNPDRVARELGPLIGMENAELKDMLERDQYQVELGSGSKYLTLSEREEIEQLDLAGIHFREEPTRYYPNQTFASHVLGYMSRDMSEAHMGLEAGLNEELTGKDGTRTESEENALLDEDETTTNTAEDGKDVYLTLDGNIQSVLEQSMSEVEESYSPNKIMGIVADADSGEILGMSNRPSFNPNEYEEIENYTNYAVSDQFEPGSTMKIFTLAAAIDKGVFEGKDTYESGTYNVSGETIRDHNNGEGWGEITYNEGLRRSSNVAFMRIALEILPEGALFNYLEKFGFGQETGIDLPNEADGALAEETPLNVGITAFGQASTVTPIQMIQGATAIANDGKMMQPYVIDHIENPNNNETTYESEPNVAGKPISKKAAEKTRKKLQTVIEGEHGTGAPYQIDGVEVAGKTGTAQISDPEGGGYLSGENQNIFSFIGMAPVDDPEIIVYVVVDRPELEPTETGSDAVSAIFNPVMQQSLSYMNLTPSDVEDTKAYEESGIEFEDYTGKSVNKAENAAENAGLQPVVIGSGSQVENQIPTNSERLIVGEKVIILTNGQKSIPDVSGWSLREIQRLEALLEIDIDTSGSGYVSSQSVDPGTAVSAAGNMEVELVPPDELEDAQAEQTEAEETDAENENRGQQPQEAETEEPEAQENDTEESSGEEQPAESEAPVEN
ncbi:penicillin-binding protein [Marinococcus sp. PL1-022]|uniref:penicillin-binding protein n=1 Tax=Marinococcus sp. PL1-022 TaxID=3095363 RepID=UPI0029C103B5|nr:penicillin-binding protein [Marinococcus sp. PL1-022]MDX6152386.1 penicillin-binding protein [Marinococcus sp. PL1-022]